MSGSFSFSPSQSNLLDSFTLHNLAVPVKRIGLYLAFCVLVGLVVSVLSGDTDVTEMIKFSCFMLALGGVIFVALRLIVRFWWMPHYARRVFKQQADLHQQIDVRWDDANFTTQTANAFVNTPWSDFHLWNRDDRVMLLYRSESLFNFFPLDSAEGQSAADEIQAHLLGAGIKRRP